MSEPGNEHDDLVRRLRESGTARAPERLRPDVMARVRAEPRRRRRRSIGLARPLLPYAVAACVLVVAVFGLSHLDLSGAGSSSAGGGVSAAGTAEKGASPRTPSTTDTATAYRDVAPKAFSLLARRGGRVYAAASPTDSLDQVNAAALRALTPHRVVLVVSASQLAAYAARLRALEHTGHGSGLTVVLEPRR